MSHLGIPSGVPQPVVGKDGIISAASVHAAAVLRNYNLNPRLGTFLFFPLRFSEESQQHLWDFLFRRNDRLVTL